MAKIVKKMNDCCNDSGSNNSSFVAIPSAMAGIFLVLAVLFLLFARDSLALLIPIVWAFVVLGFFALLFAYKAAKK